ncbi:LPS export ABC transporter permease LptF [Roseitalea porphyridii]|uniref:LPS export ABC transporter permease LptF n=1 Tax=Roseitalea porphyridii TaxID=1852022 RepID=UPI00131521C4|nr:LPS export ABC transporter permease LptF [Roseitalea porphyridii]
MRTVERYIFRRVAIASLSAFAAILAVVWVTQAVTRIDFATGSAGSIGAFLTMMVLLTPQFVTLTLPFGLLIGTVNVLNAMNADSEMPVMAGSGIGRMAFARPVLIVAVALGATVFLVSHLVEPRANRAVRDIVTDLRTDLLATLIQDGRFTEVEDGLTIYVDRKDAGGRLSGVMIADKRNPETHLLQFAQEAVVDDSGDVSLLVLREGQLHRTEVATGQVSIIRFQSYAVDLARFGSATGSHTYLPHERETAYLLDPDANDPTLNTWPGLARGELHRRLSEWLYPILFALVALVLAGQPRSHRTTSIMTVVLAFGAGLGYRWGSYFAYNTIKIDGALFWLLYAVPLGGIALSVLMYLRGWTVAVPDRAMLAVQRFAGKLGGPSRAGAAAS